MSSDRKSFQVGVAVLQGFNSNGRPVNNTNPATMAFALLLCSSLRLLKSYDLEIFVFLYVFAGSGKHTCGVCSGCNAQK